MLVSKLKASRLARVSRTTIYRYINDGKLSESGGKIDTSELMRVFGAISEQDSVKPGERPSVQRVTPPNDALLQQLLAEKDKRIDELAKDRDHWRDLAEEQNIRLLSHQGSTGPQTAQVVTALVMLGLLIAVVAMVISFT